MPTITLQKTRFVKVASYNGNLSFSNASSFPGPGELIAQFTLPAAAAEGVITKATFKMSYQGPTYAYEPPGAGSYYRYSAWQAKASIACYVSDDVSAQLTYNNFENYGNLTALQSLGFAAASYYDYNRSGSYEYYDYSYQSGRLNVDVTGLINSNIKNNIIGFYITGTTGQREASEAYESATASAYSNPVLEITYEAPSAKTPSIVFPSDVYIKEGTQINLSWLYNSNGSATQQSAVVEYHDSSSDTWTVKTLSGQATNYIVPEALAKGLVTWRIKTTDSNGNTSEYATATFTIIGRPAAPVVTSVANAKLTAISWNSEEQVSYKFSLYKDGILLDQKDGSDDIRQYKPNFFLENGDYTFVIAVSNAADMWSVDTSKLFTINVTSAPSKPTMSLTALQNDGVRINVPNETDTFYVVKNDVVIAKTVGAYSDYEIVPGVTYTYKLRAYDGAGYTDSDVKTFSVEYTGFYLASDDLIINVETSTNEFIPLEETIERDKAVMSYSGRKLPIVEMGEERSRAITRQVTVKTKEELELLKSLYEKADLIYRDTEGNCIHATISNITISRWKGFGWNVQLVMKQIDSDEVVINA